MALSDEKQKEYAKRLLMARLRVLSENGFYGLLLMHIRFGLDETCDTAYTDGDRIMFCPKFMDELIDSELDFILMHEIMHIALRHCFRLCGKDPYLANIACDIVVNSNIKHSLNDDPKAITIGAYGESMHLAPNKKEGYNYTAEEVYAMIEKRSGKGKKGKGNNSGKGKGGKSDGGDYDDCNLWDDHSKWKDGDSEKEELWKKRLEEARDAMAEREKIIGRGLVPMAVERLLEELNKQQIDWRQILHTFIQEEVVDYTFMPPDRRFSDYDFFLPDFNGRDENVKDILFMIDTSGSMSKKMISEVYSEVKGAMSQFDGKLSGWLGFFDAEVVEPKHFEDEEQLSVIRAYGGGGTDFNCIFNYVREKMSDNLPASIIILTDGYAPFPKQNVTMNIPVLWVINNKEITPPWGKVIRIESEEH